MIFFCSWGHLLALIYLRLMSPGGPFFSGVTVTWQSLKFFFWGRSHLMVSWIFIRGWRHLILLWIFFQGLESSDGSFDFLIMSLSSEWILIEYLVVNFFWCKSHLVVLRMCSEMKSPGDSLHFSTQAEVTWCCFDFFLLKLETFGVAMIFFLEGKITWWSIEFFFLNLETFHYFTSFVTRLRRR